MHNYTCAKFSFLRYPEDGQGKSLLNNPRNYYIVSKPTHVTIQFNYELGRLADIMVVKLML